MSPVFAWPCIFLALAGILGASDVPNPPKPTGFLLDEARVFSAEQATQLKTTLETLNSQKGVSCYIATFSSLEGGIKQRAFSLMQDWIGNEPGILVAYSWGEGLPKVMATPAFWRRYPTDEVLVMLQRAAPLLNDVNLSASKRLGGTVDIYVDDIQKMESLRLLRERPYPAEERSLLYYLATTSIFFLALSWWGAGWLRKRLARHQTYFLPEVEVSRRLGAPYGGGKMTQIQS